MPMIRACYSGPLDSHKVHETRDEQLHGGTFGMFCLKCVRCFFHVCCSYLCGLAFEHSLIETRNSTTSMMRKPGRISMQSCLNSVCAVLCLAYAAHYIDYSIVLE